jgi:hypothetical protein
MFELTGKCCGALDAIEFFESLPVVIDEESKDTEFCDKYEAALNRFRYEAAKGIGCKIRILKAVKSWHHDTYSCGHCGAGVTEANWKYCPTCGTKIIR